MRNKAHSLLVFIFILFGSTGTAVSAGQLSNVLIISIDALHPDALHQTKIPTISKLMESGTYTLHGRSTEPPKTLIAHTAMFTGLWLCSKKTDNPPANMS